MNIITKFREQIGELFTSQTVDENGNPIESITTPTEQDDSRLTALENAEQRGVLSIRGLPGAVAAGLLVKMNSDSEKQPPLTLRNPAVREHRVIISAPEPPDRTVTR